MSEYRRHIFSLTFGSFMIIPTVWKTAYVFPLHKGGTKSELNHFRPISKLSCFQKILESLVNGQLKLFLSTHSIIIPFQSCFRPKLSVISATSLVINNIVSALDNKKHCAVLFIDLTKAFETVGHSLLFSSDFVVL